MESSKIQIDGNKNKPNSAEVEDWLVASIAQLLDINPEEIDVSTPFDSYGMDSSAAVGLTGDLETWLKCQIDPTVVYYHPTIKALVKHLSDSGQIKE